MRPGGDTAWLEDEFRCHKGGIHPHFRHVSSVPTKAEHQCGSSVLSYCGCRVKAHSFFFPLTEWDDWLVEHLKHLNWQDIFQCLLASASYFYLVFVCVCVCVCVCLRECVCISKHLLFLSLETVKLPEMEKNLRSHTNTHTHTPTHTDSHTHTNTHKQSSSSCPAAAYFGFRDKRTQMWCPPVSFADLLRRSISMPLTWLIPEQDVHSPSRDKKKSHLGLKLFTCSCFKKQKMKPLQAQTSFHDKILSRH